MIKLFTIMAAFLFLGLTPTIIESDNLDYDGYKTHLKGHVRLIHTMGEIQAEEAFIHKEGSQKDLSYIEALHGGSFSLAAGGKIQFDSMKFFVDEKKIELLSKNPSYPISYQGNLSNQPFILNASKMILQLGKSSEKEAFRGIESVDALGPITLSLQEALTLSSNRAKYHQSSQIIEFFSENPNEECLIDCNNLMQIKAPKVEISTDKHQVCAFNPQGSMSSKKDGMIHFEASFLIFDEEKDLIYLLDPITVTSDNYQIFNDKRASILINREESGSFKELKMTGNTYIETNLGLKLSCHGTVKIDQVAKKIELQAVKEPILFYSPQGTIQSQYVLIDYTLESREWVPNKILFKGHVVCKNNKTLFENDEEEVMRFALAELVIFNPETKELILKGQKPSRVLFYDECKKTKFSAEEMIIDLPSGEKKERIRTIGNVRMVFNEKEDSEMKKYFSLGE